MPASLMLTNFCLLPELNFVKSHRIGESGNAIYCHKLKTQEYCTRCGSGKNWTHEYRWISVKDEPIRGKYIVLKIRKRRLKCCDCGKIFSEPVQGVLPRKRLTQRFKKSLLWACENFKDLKKVRKNYRCSSDTLYKALYETLEQKRRERLNYAWPTTIGIDEHSFKKDPVTRKNIFATMVIDFNNKRPFEVVEGKSGGCMWDSLAHIPGRENVKNVALDLCDPYKKFVKDFFPNADIVADKFHVLRLLNHHIMRRRKEITGDRASWQARKLLLMSNKKLNYSKRKALWEYLDQHPELKEVYAFKESLHSLYRCKGYSKAERALQKMTDRMALSTLPEIKTIRKTLIKWRYEILNYFKTRITNARTEAFNNIAKLLKRNSFGIKEFKHYRLRVLNVAF
jgi:transposase